MIFQNRLLKSLLAIFLIWTFFTGIILTTAQDLPPNEDLSLGASVFVFRSSGRTAQKRFVSASRAKRTKTQRVAATKKIRRQYENLAVVKTRRSRVKIAAPTVSAAPIDIKRKTPKEASLALTGSGLYLYEQNEIDKSIDIYEEALELDAENADAKLGLSDAYARKGGDLLEAEKPREAVYYFDQAIKNNDKNSVAYSGLGEIHDALDDNDKAIANYEKALSLDAALTELNAPLGVLYYQKNDLKRADELLSKSLSTNQGDFSTQYFLGLIRYKQNRYEDARAALTQAKSLDETMPEVRLSLGEVLDKLDREAEAIAEYKEAARLKPTYVDAWFYLGSAYYEQKKYEESIAAYKEAIKLKNDSGEAHANLADAYRQLGKCGEANGSYSLAAAFIKDDAELYSNWGFCLGKVNKWDNAVMRLNQAIALSADHIDYTNLGWALYNSAQVDLKSKREADAKTKLQQAKTALSKAVGMNQNFAPAQINLGITLNDLGEYQAAVTALKQANELRKNWLFAVNELGIAYRKLNDYGNAVKQFERAVEIDDKYAIGYFNLGEAQLRSGNAKGAKKSHEKLKKLNKNLANALEVMILGAKLK